MLDNEEQLGYFLKSEVVNLLGVKISFDTHYDAQNWELSWWNGNTHHRMDFQPLERGEISITHYKDHFPCLPKLFYWAHNAIPMFPYYARVEWNNLVKKHFPLEEAEVRAFISMATK